MEKVFFSSQELKMKTIRSSYQHTDPINRKTCLFEAFSLENADKKRLRKNSETFRKKRNLFSYYGYVLVYKQKSTQDKITRFFFI